MYISIDEDKIKELIQNNSSKSIGVLISLLAYEYIKQHKITEKEFIKSLKNSLNILKKED